MGLDDERPSFPSFNTSIASCTLLPNRVRSRCHVVNQPSSRVQTTSTCVKLRRIVYLYSFVLHATAIAVFVPTTSFHRRCIAIYYRMYAVNGSELRKRLFFCAVSLWCFCLCMKCLGSRNRCTDLRQIHMEDVFGPSLGRV